MKITVFFVLVFLGGLFTGIYYSNATNPDWAEWKKCSYEREVCVKQVNELFDKKYLKEER